MLKYSFLLYFVALFFRQLSVMLQIDHVQQCLSQFILQLLKILFAIGLFSLFPLDFRFKAEFIMRSQTRSKIVKANRKL